STKGLGPVAAIGIGVGLLAMITLLPALLVIFGRWLFWPVRPKFGTTDPTTRGTWSKVGQLIARRPRVVWVATALILGAFAFGITDLKATGLTTAQSFINKPDSVVGAEVLAAHFPAGSGQPVVVISKAAAATQVHNALASTPGIDRNVPDPVVKGDYAYLTGTLLDPPDSKAANDTVDRVRANVHQVEGAQAVVGGQTAIIHDIQRAATHDNQRIIPIVLLVVLVILGLLLRALV